jgi:glycosyltransferase involved in cell wall biosynthesis
MFMAGVHHNLGADAPIPKLLPPAVVNDPSLPLVSIVTPSYNQGQFIRETIESVLAQDYPNIEYLIVDGGSQDSTLDVLRQYHQRIHWISEPDSGQADAVNKGIAMTHGAIVAWLNSDDVYVPGAVSCAVGHLLAQPEAALLYGQAEEIDHTSAITRRYTHIDPFDLQRLIHSLDFIVQPATFFRRTSFLAVGGLDTSLHYCLDYDLWIKLALRFPILHTWDVLARSRVYPETKTASGGLERLKEMERMIRRYGRPLLPSIYYREMISACLHAGIRSLAARDWHEWWWAWRRGGFYLAAILVRGRYAMETSRNRRSAIGKSR